jgi:hypothetical protein
MILDRLLPDLGAIPPADSQICGICDTTRDGLLGKMVDEIVTSLMEESPSPAPYMSCLVAGVCWWCELAM